MIDFIVKILPEFVLDALKDSLSLVPFLFVIFVLIEVFEHYFSNKIKDFVKYSRSIGPVIGAIAAVVPQCGFSVIASTLYIRRFISMGTLFAVYIATSDEAIPVLLSKPQYYKEMIAIVIIKCILAIIAGYGIDIIYEKIFKKKQMLLLGKADISDNQKGCCGHSINERKRDRFIFHPLRHTAHIWVFIFAVCLILNWLFEKFGIENIQNYMLQNSVIQPVITGIVGLIPNCAISVVITMMFINGVITLGSTISGLSSSAGLGLLVLIQKNENKKNTLFVISVLLMVSIVAGVIVQLITK
ncbi:arsenic efflux protein [bacterium]|nr:arsenic efflux protein [bacterium]